MRINSKFLISTILLGLTCSTPRLVRSEIPGQSDLKGNTTATFCNALLDMNHKTLTEDYKRVGAHDPKWDKDAVSFLDALANWFSFSTADILDNVPPIQDMPELQALAKKLMAEKCDDPLVLYVYGRVIDNSPGEERARIESMMPLLLKSRYSDLRKYFALQKIESLYTSPNDPVITPNWRAELAQTEAGALSKESVDALGPMGPRCILYILQSDWDRTGLHEQLLQRYETAKLHPYVLNLLRGHYHLDRFCNGDGDRQQEYDQAVDAFQTAWKDYPQFPEAPQYMVWALAYKGNSVKEARVWFDRTTKIQFDYTPVYHAYRTAIRSGRGDIPQQLKAFSQECLDTKRFDTRVPAEFLCDLKEQTWDDRQGDPILFAKPENYSRLIALLDSYRAVLPQPRGVAYVDGLAAGVSCLAGNYNDAAPRFARLHTDEPLKEPFQSFNVLHLNIPRERTKAAAYAASAQTQAADAAALNHKYDDAITQLGGVLSKLSATDSGVPYIKSRLVEIAVQQKLAAGDTADIQPSKDLTGWIPFDGKWSVDKTGALVNTEPGSIFFMGDVGPRFTFSCHMERAGASDEYDRMGAYVDWQYESSNTGRQTLVRICPADFNVELAPRSDRWRTDLDPVKAAITGSDDITITRWDDLIWVSVNGKEVIHAAQVDKSCLSNGNIGLMSAHQAKATTRFTNITVAPLLKRPPIAD